MNKHVLFGTLASLAAVFAAGSANAESHTVSLSAQVPTSCTVESVTLQSGDAFSAVTKMSSNFEATIDGSVAVATNGVIEFNNVSCNGGNIGVTLNPEKLQHESQTTVGDSINYIDYTAEATLDGLQQVAKVDTSVSTNSQSGNSGETSHTIDLEIDILPTAPGKTLIAGQYSGTLQISIDPI